MGLKLWVCVVVFSFSFAWSAVVPKEEERSLVHGGWKVPSQISPFRIEKLLNEFARHTYGKAFRFIGVEDDFDHGHILFEKKADGFYPRAILYHTQEFAYSAHWRKNVDSKYDYINVTTRNWIQWLSDNEAIDGKQIFNAKEYLDPTKKDPSQFENLEPQEKFHYTLNFPDLDPNKLGFKTVADLQFEFRRCKPEPNANPFSPNQPIWVRINGENHSLNLTTMTYLNER